MNVAGKRGNPPSSMPRTAGAKLRAERVSYTYFNARTGKRLLALDGIDVSVEEGEFVSIVGPSGCGKTTFLNIIDGLLPVSSGSVYLDGRLIDAPGPDRAMVFQSACLLPWRTVHGNITWALELRGISRAEARSRASGVISLVGLAGFESSYPHELSGGMQQRVNLARALAVDPEMILLDEPFAALDAQTRDLMQEELLRIWQKDRKTALFITHQISEAVFLSDRVLVFGARPGRLREDIAIDLPRPRNLHLKRSPEFRALEDRIWTLIEEEARQGLVTSSDR